jgi:hypothetical protein
MEKEALWRIVIDKKRYGTEWGVVGLQGDPYGISLWKHIISGREILSRFITFEVGSGLCICFLCMILGVGKIYSMVFIRGIFV